jgi:cation diffusion facilitator CzcD-associated flavoprotein CzcO
MGYGRRMAEDYDVIVIGAGLNGLATTALLAKQGRRVLCLEKNAYVGGMGRTRRWPWLFRRHHGWKRLDSLENLCVSLAGLLQRLALHEASCAVGSAARRVRGRAGR